MDTFMSGILPVWMPAAERLLRHSVPRSFQTHFSQMDWELFYWLLLVMSMSIGPLCSVHRVHAGTELV